MPDQRYEAGRRTVGELLSITSPRIEVPDWQRSYAWTSDQIEAFWQDLITFSDRYPDDNITHEEYFLGSVVLVTSGQANLLLDGQQRLATATILLSVLRDARRNYKGDAAARLQNKYISEFNDGANKTSYVLTLNVYDREFFRREIQDEPANPRSQPDASLRSHSLIRKARLFFADVVEKESEVLGGGEQAFQRNLRLSTVLCDHMSVVVVSSTNEDNAAEVFETLNDRGIGLSTPDLLRNLVLRRAVDGTSRDRIVEAWQKILSINEDVAVDGFLRHYWVSRYGDVKARKLYREIKEKILKENISSLDLSLELSDSALVYREIVAARDDDSGVGHVLESIKELGAKALYPVLLSGYSVLSGDGDDDSGKRKLCELGRALVSMFVRYNVIGGRETTIMEASAYGVAEELRRTGDFDRAIRRIVDLAPDSKEFVQRFGIARVTRTATIRYLLRQIEHAKRGTEEVSVDGGERVHIEHIYPQTPVGERWSNHSAVINRLGNLTLLGKRLNTSIKNGDFATKKEKGYTGSDIKMTQELMQWSSWDAKAIDERQRELARWAFDIWKFPGETFPEEIEQSQDVLGLWHDESGDESEFPELPLGLALEVDS